MNDETNRYRVVILGGGIHGVGVLHDLASRGWRDTLLVEKGTLGQGTSSRSTKLIHGGLRYLEHVRDFSLVSEGLRERRLLMQVAPDLVKPLPLIFPVLHSGGMPRMMIKAGLSLYDFLAGAQGIGRHYSIDETEAQARVPTLDTSLFKHFYVFFDGQTDDLGLVRRVAKSAKSLGGHYREHTRAERIRPVADGFLVDLHTPTGLQTVSCRYIINALGPWAHEVFDASGISPKYVGINNKGAHIIVEDMGLKSGLFLQSPEDGRVLFVLPWQGKTLIGTTETEFSDKPDLLKTNSSDVAYILDHCNRYFRKKITENDIIGTFSGLRWLAKDPSAGLTDMSRSHLISQHRIGPGCIYTIYGGKLTAYRALSEEIGDMVVRHFGEDAPSRTADIKSWISPEIDTDLVPVPQRFAGM